MFLNKKAFSLLELVVVLIIISALAALALPRFFKLIEVSRSTEALTILKVWRDGLERCFAATGNYTSCAGTWDAIQMDNPFSNPGNHFIYFSVYNPDQFTLYATRNTLDGGNTADYITLEQNNTTGVIKITGYGNYASIK